MATSAKATQKNRMIGVGTPLGEDVLLLRGGTFVEELGRPFQLSLDMLSDNADIKLQDILGQNVTVRIECSQGTDPRYINGFVAAFSKVGVTGKYTQYAATVVPWIWFLTRTSDCRIFQNMSLPDIVKKVFRDKGFTDFDESLTGTHNSWEYCVQYRETDFNFVTRLMEQEGIYYYFRHEDGKHTLVLADSTPQSQPCGAYQTIPLRSTYVHNFEYLHTWVASGQVLPGTYAHNDFDFTNPKANLQTKSQISRPHTLSSFEMYDYPGIYKDSSGGETAARWRIEEAQNQYQTYSGKGNVRGISAGYTLELDSDPGTNYFVTAASMSFQTDAYQTGSAGSTRGDSLECALTAIPCAESFRLARVTPKPLIVGPQTAVVVGPSGEEIYTDQYGRVKVAFHWDRYTAADENSSCFIRVAQVWAGKQWGGMFIPRIGQEVIVEFLEGDPNRPIVTGRVYNADTMPPYTLPDNATMSTVKSNSSKGGEGFNEIRYEDKKGSEQIFVHAQKNMDTRILNDTMLSVGNDSHGTIGQEKDGNKQGNRREKVFVNKSVLINKNQDEQVGGDMKLLVGGIDGPGNLDIAVKATKKETINTDCHNHVKGDRNEKVDGNQSLTVGTNLQDKAGQNYAMDAGQNVHIKAGMTMVLEAGMQLSLKVGGNFIDIGPSGISIVASPTLMLNSGGSPASGSGSNPTSPQDAADAAPPDPTAAADSTTGQVSDASATPGSQQAVQTDSSSINDQPDEQADAFQNASQNGTPFCQQCQQLQQQQQQQSGGDQAGGDGSGGGQDNSNSGPSSDSGDSTTGS